MLSFKPAFLLFSFTFINRVYSSSSLSTIIGIIRICEAIDIFPRNLYSSLSFIQPSISHDILCIYFPHFFCDPHRQSFSVVNETQVDTLLKFPCCMIKQMFTIGSLVPLPFLNPAYISGSFWITFCWSLA